MKKKTIRWLAISIIMILAITLVSACTPTPTPTVSSTIPANLATGVAINSTVTATFSEAMDPLTVTTATFTLNQGATTCCRHGDLCWRHGDLYPIK